MAIIKSFTDLSQSKVLAEFLPLESADMHWQYIEEDNGQLQWFCFPKDFSINQHDTISAWSLTALLNVLPDYTLQTNTDGTVFVVCDSKKPMISDAYSSPVDACYELIIKLHDQKLL